MSSLCKLSAKVHTQGEKTPYLTTQDSLANTLVVDSIYRSGVTRMFPAPCFTPPKKVYFQEKRIAGGNSIVLHGEEKKSSLTIADQWVFIINIQSWSSDRNLGGKVFLTSCTFNYGLRKVYPLFHYRTSSMSC